MGFPQATSPKAGIVRPDLVPKICQDRSVGRIGFGIATQSLQQAGSAHVQIVAQGMAPQCV